MKHTNSELKTQNSNISKGTQIAILRMTKNIAKNTVPKTARNPKRSLECFIPLTP